jgi:CheY-like chemotaxis protein
VCHALIVEDNFLLADHVAELAEAAGATSFDYAETENDAVEAACARRPDIILSDVHLLIGNGPAAVASIQAKIGPVAVIFITANPADCVPCDPPIVVMEKPVRALDFTREFTRLTAR